MERLELENLEIVHKLRASGKRVQVLCSTGMACEVFKGKLPANVFPITVHSFLGIGTAQAPFDTVVGDSLRETSVVQRIQGIETFIWDECSMGSARLLELFNTICSKARQSSCAFGGIQGIIVGDWLQLKPVGNSCFDAGRMMYFSAFYPRLFPHIVELKMIHRQDASQERFKAALQELRKGVCSVETAHYITSLRRPLQKSSGDEPIHLYFTNAFVDAHNAIRLHEHEGEIVKFTGKASGYTVSMKYPAPMTAFFKPDAPVVCLYNVNTRYLHNGTIGSFVRKNDDGSAVMQVGCVEHTLNEVSWLNINKDGVPCGAFTQIPLKLKWASTVHKAQGQQYPSVVLHSSFEFSGGLLYTALTRVKSDSDIQVLDFNPLQVMPRDDEVNEIGGLLRQFYADDLSCCSKPVPKDVEPNDAHPDRLSGLYIPSVCDSAEEPSGIDDDEDVRQESAEHDILRSLYVETADSDDQVDQGFLTLEDALESMERFESFLSEPPEDFDFKSFLTSLKYNSELMYNSFSSAENSLIDKALQYIPHFILLLKFLWLKVYEIFHKHLSANVSESNLSMALLREAGSHVYGLASAEDVKDSLKLFYGILANGNRRENGLSQTEVSLGTSIILGVFQNFMHILADTIVQKEGEAVAEFSVKGMNAAGKGAVRYISGWAVSRLLKKGRKYIAQNMYSSSQKVLLTVKKELSKIRAIEQQLVIPHGILCKVTKYPETLSVTESRQYRTHGLIHVTDEFYLFGLELEQQRVKLLRPSVLHALGTEDIVEHVKGSLKNNASLIKIWDDLFPKVTEGIIKSELREGIIDRVVHMGTSQFLKDFKRSYFLKKTLAHRHMVMVRKERMEHKSAKLSLQQMYSDCSPGKLNTHQQLQGMIAKYGETIIWKVYTRVELSVLCQAYGIKCCTREKKAEIGGRLAPVVKGLNSIPAPWYLNDVSNLTLQPGARAENRAQGVVASIRITRAKKAT